MTKTTDEEKKVLPGNKISFDTKGNLNMFTIKY